jgi:uncharacterized protein (DUF983 family)
VNVSFPCPHCEVPARLEIPGPADWQCPACGHQLHLAAAGAESLSGCAVCGNHELYRKKDFPHWLGLTILTVACVLSVLTYGWYYKWLTWAILIGSAAIDGLMYLLVGDVVVCYRCHAHYRGLHPGAAFPPHDLGVAERYRQEQIRREQLQAEKKATL